MSSLTQYSSAGIDVSTEPKRRRVLIAGASGFLGQAVSWALAQAGYSVAHLTRRQIPPSSSAIPWDPAAGQLDPRAVEGCAAVLNLAGASIATRWTVARKRVILDSRVRTTELLSRTIASFSQPPAVFISASAVGYYGTRGAEVLTEESTPGPGFLAEVCQAWEAACDPARAAGIRVVLPRIAVVLSPAGGVLARLLPIFRAGLGGPLGDGRQYFPWISLPDFTRAIEFVLRSPALHGPINFSAPAPSTQHEFAQALASAVHRPMLLQVPAFALIAAMGEAAEALLLTSQLVMPQVLLERGFTFQHPGIKPALAALLG